MQHLTCDVTGADLTESEATTIRISGPLASMLDRRSVHLGKRAARALAEWLTGEPIDRPELETVPGPSAVSTG